MRACESMTPAEAHFTATIKKPLLANFLRPLDALRAAKEQEAQFKFQLDIDLSLQDCLKIITSASAARDLQFKRLSKVSRRVLESNVEVDDIE